MHLRERLLADVARALAVELGALVRGLRASAARATAARTPASAAARAAPPARRALRSCAFAASRSARRNALAICTRSCRSGFATRPASVSSSRRCSRVSRVRCERSASIARSTRTQAVDVVLGERRLRAGAGSGVSWRALYAAEARARARGARQQRRTTSPLLVRPRRSNVPGSPAGRGTPRGTIEGRAVADHAVHPGRYHRPQDYEGASQVTAEIFHTHHRVLGLALAARPFRVFGPLTGVGLARNPAAHGTRRARRAPRHPSTAMLMLRKLTGSFTCPCSIGSRRRYLPEYDAPLRIR